MKQCVFLSECELGGVCDMSHTAAVHHGEQVDAQGLHAMLCKNAPGRTARHQVLVDLEVPWLCWNEAIKQWRRQDLLLRWAKLEIMSWGTRVELQCRVSMTNSVVTNAVLIELSYELLTSAPADLADCTIYWI